WDGARWTLVTLPGSTSQGNMAAIWASGPNDVWAFGEQAYHRDAQGWHAVAGGMLAQHAWGAGPGDVWGIAAGVVFHTDGVTWREVSPESSLPSSLWGVSPNQIWLGSHGGLQQW